jgi:hypothetical protein
MPSLKLPYEAATRASTDPFRCRGGVSRTPGNLPDRLLLNAFGPSLTIGAGMHRAAVEERPALDGKRLVMNVANDMSLRLQNDVASLDRPLNPSVHDDAAGSDGSGNVSAPRNDERGAMQFAVDLTVDLDQALGGDGSDNL